MLARREARRSRRYRNRHELRSPPRLAGVTTLRYLVGGWVGSILHTTQCQSHATQHTEVTAITDTVPHPRRPLHTPISLARAEMGNPAPNMTRLFAFDRCYCKKRDSCADVVALRPLRLFYSTHHRQTFLRNKETWTRIRRSDLGRRRGLGEVTSEAGPGGD